MFGTFPAQSPGPLQALPPQQGVVGLVAGGRVAVVSSGVALLFGISGVFPLFHADGDLRLRCCELLRFGPVDPNGNIPGGRAQLLIKSGVSSDPQVILRDLHGAKKPRSRCRVQPQQESGDRNHIILHKGLVKKCIQHADTKHPPSSKRQSEHKGQIRTSLSLFLFQL